MIGRLRDFIGDALGWVFQRVVDLLYGKPRKDDTSSDGEPNS